MKHTHSLEARHNSLFVFPFNFLGSFRLSLPQHSHTPKTHGDLSQLVVRWWKIYSHKVPVGVHIQSAADLRWQQPLRPRGWSRAPRCLSSGDLPLNFFCSRTLVRHTTTATGWRLQHQVKADCFIAGAVTWPWFRQPMGAAPFRSAV